MKIDKNILISFISGAVASLIIFGILFVIFLNFPGRIYEKISTNYLKDIKNSAEKNSENLNFEGSNSHEALVIASVRKATPAVASVIVTKELPKYETYFEQSPFGGGFFGIPDYFFNIPKQRQNGTEKKEIGGGTGFFVSADGYMLTNRHVVEDEGAEYTVITNDGKKYEAKILGRDKVLDIAVLKVDGKNFDFLELGDSDRISVGQSVIAIGNALAEFKNSVSVGVVSGLSRSLTAGDSTGKTELLSNVIQTDAAINPGNSGGPLLDLLGKVIGVNVAVVRGSENIGFALPINSIKSVIESIKKTGKIERPFVGIRYVQITESLKEKNNLAVDYGILVLRGENKDELAVIPGSPADKAGILENDIILEIDGKKLTEDQSFALVIREKKAGDKINLKVLSKGKEKNISLNLENSPD